MNQELFLGHPNLVGVTTSMRDTQYTQTKLWADSYAASIRAGSTAYTAINHADAAIAAFNMRFVPKQEN